MDWLKSHIPLVGGGGAAALMLILWQRGFFGWASNFSKLLFRAYRDQARDEAIQRCNDCLQQLSEVRATLRSRVLTDDARDEIHQQDLSDKKQMSASIARLTARMKEHGIPFDDLL